MKNLNYLFLFFLFPILGFSQKTGKVFSENGEPIAYALVYPLQGYPIFTNEAGQFSFEYYELKMMPDSVKISALGYQTKKLAFPESYKEIVLLRKSNTTNPIIKTNNSNSTFGFPSSFNPKKIRSQSAHVYSVGHQILRFIKNTKEKSGKIEKVSFGISKKGKNTAPFRVRVYSVNKETGFPSEDLLIENVVTQYDSKRNGRHTIDLSKYNIPFPIEGVFVAMEWLHTDLEKYAYKKTFHHRYKRKTFRKPINRYGQELLIYKLPEKKKYWTYRPSWKKYTWRKYDWNSDPIIQLKASFDE